MTASAAATATPTGSAAPTGTASPTAPPGTQVSSVYDPPAGAAPPYFPTSPMYQPIPANPTPNSNSSTWASVYANGFDLGTVGAIDYSVSGAVAHDFGAPIYMNHAGTNTPVTIHCTESWGTCNVEGKTIYIDQRELPEDGGTQGADSHFVLVDPVAGYEYQLWHTSWPPSSGKLTIGWGGRCALTGDGYTNPSYHGPATNSGCSGDATSTPLSTASVRAKDLMFALQDSVHGSLPYAVPVAPTCTEAINTPVAPMLGSDGVCSNVAPEGEKGYLAMHDDDVNALSAAPISKVFMRTMDEDHYGFLAVMSGGGSSPDNVMHVQSESDLTYVSWGQQSPWLAQYVPEAQNEGLPGSSSAYQGRWLIDPPIPSSVGALVRYL